MFVYYYKQKNKKLAVAYLKFRPKSSA